MNLSFRFCILHINKKPNCP